MSERPTESAVEKEQSLYEKRKKLYVRAIDGRFQRWRWFFVLLTQAIYYGLPWLDWNGRQAVLFHLVERKFYLFGWVFWPQDVFFLALILILSAYALFFFTTIAGRLWCGYACPQTVYTEIFMWLEAWIEGDHNARRKLDQQPWSGRKLLVRGTKYAVWVAVSLWTGFTLVMYFTPREELLAELATLSLGPWEWFWTFFYAGFTFLLAGILREQVCKYMCPYARFQGVMFDPDTLIITYDERRGEPRGPRRRGVDPRAVGLGDCVDCGMCVQVCPTGIDIRNGLQYECIGCAACVDACNEVMERIGYPRGLIRYSTENAVTYGWGRAEMLRRVVRPRVLIYGGLLLLFTGLLVYKIATRPDLRVDVLRDRATLAREVAGGWIENVYTLRLMNMTERPRRFEVTVEGIEGVRLARETTVEMPAAATESVVVAVQVPAERVKPGRYDLYFRVQVTGEPKGMAREHATFLVTP
ncbi:MAG: cytochrome c oxidase accessory protein CcoG [Hydrogenophilus sp.]|nr:cytochrome c oxidase accessory protein CcoG [Hydrogenophilus sp.]